MLYLLLIGFISFINTINLVFFSLFILSTLYYIQISLYIHTYMLHNLLVSAFLKEDPWEKQGEHVSLH